MTEPTLDGGALPRVKELLQHLNAGDWEAARAMAGATGDAAAELMAACWLRQRRPGTGPPPLDELSLVAEGWSRQFAGDPAGAADMFQRSIAAGDSWRSWSALGLGKALSSLGCWSDSRDWLLWSMALARRENDGYRLAEASGALGEVFFRAGFHPEALELFHLDRVLLPAGSAHRLRLDNYLAASLGRLGMPGAAATLFWQSFFGGMQGDPSRSWFALAGLGALSVLRGDEALAERLEAAPLPGDPGRGGAPAGFLIACRACWKIRHGRAAEAAPLLARSMEIFGTRYPAEKAWVAAVASRAGWTPRESVPAPWAAPAPTLEAAPGPASLVDRHFARAPVDPRRFHQFLDLESCPDPASKIAFFFV